MEKCCSECADPRAAHSLCTSCNKWLCYQCTDLHQHVRPTARGPAPAPAPALLQRTGGPLGPPDAAKVPAEAIGMLAANRPSCPAGSECCARTALACPLHTQDPLELFCETCDLLTCASCHLSAHKEHRVVHTGKALEDQRWLFESLMARAEEKRSVVENMAKQIEDRMHSVKVTQRRAENQIKMAKMIMMNELNKRANLLIEQLESVSGNFKRHLEEELQGAIETCSTLDQVQSFISWATTHHQSSPLLFSKELITYQMQHVLDPQLHADSWAPVKIRFNWDASFWTKQISTLGQLTVEGGSCSFPEGLGHRGVLRPQPVACIAVPTLCHGLREQGCAYQTCCQPQFCCLHCTPPSRPPPPPSVPAPREKAGQEPSAHAAGCTHSPTAPLCQRPAQPAVARPTEGDPSRASAGRQQGRAPSPAMASPQPQGEQHLPDAHARAAPEHRGGAARGATETGQDREHLPGAAMDAGSSVPSSGELSVKHYQADGHEQLCSEGASGWGASPLDMSALSEGRLAGAAGQRTRGTRGTPQRDSLELRGPAQHWPSGAPHSLPTVVREQPGSTEQSGSSVAQERSSALDGVQSRGPQPGGGSCCLTSYKTEPENVCVYAYDSPGHKHKTKYRIARRPLDHSSGEAGIGPKVPVVCLERLKILVSRRPPQSQPPPHTPLAQDQGMKPEELTGQKQPSEVPGGETAQGQEGHPTSPQGQEGHPAASLGQEEHPVASEERQPLEPPAAGSSPSLTDSLWPPDAEEHSADKALMPEAASSGLEPASVPESEPLQETASVTDLGSEGTLGSEPLREWDHSSQGDSHAESDLDLESEQPAETELSSSSGESEPDLESESEPDSTAEVAVCLEPEPQQPLPLPESTPPPEEAEEQEAQQEAQQEVEMENEDFCAVCLIGGELLCCDRCPKVYHLSCHVPPLLSFPTGDWVCSLCRDVQQPEVEYDCENTRLSAELKGKALPYGLSACDLRKCEKLTLLIFTHALSAPFHEPVSPLARHYYQIIKRPMDLSVIRSKLNKSSHLHYFNPEEFVADVSLMFRNCAKFNYPDSEVASAGRSLEAFFSSRLREVFPNQAFSSAGAAADDSDSEDEYEHLQQRPAKGFSWPETREHSHRKRKRRHSLSGRRQHF